MVKICKPATSAWGRCERGYDMLRPHAESPLGDGDEYPVS